MCRGCNRTAGVLPLSSRCLCCFSICLRMPSQASDECRWVPMFFRAPQMTDHFWHTGPNGRHKCMTFEAFKITENRNHLWNVLQVGLLYLYPQVILGLAGQVMGENLLALVKHYDYNGIPLDLCRRLSRPGSNCSPWFQWCSMSVFPHSSLTKLFGERCLAGIFALKRRWGTKLPNYITDRITKRQGTPSFIKLRPCFNAMAARRKKASHRFKAL